MIRYIKGKVVREGEEHIIIESGGLGFKVLVSPTKRKELNSDEEEVMVWTDFVFSEKGVDIFGFAEERELEVFEMLKGVHRVGPRLAHKVVSQLGTQGVLKAIRTGDVGALSLVKGLGRKNAQRIIITLSPKIVVFEDKTGKLAEALTSMGYTKREIEEVISKMSEAEELEGSLEELIKKALSYFVRR